MKRSEQGSVLLLALLVTLIILGIGLTVMWVASSGSKMSGNITRRQEALYAAEAGIERGRKILFDNPDDWTPFLQGCSASRNSTTLGNILCTNGTSGTALQYERVIPASSATETKVNTLAGGIGLKNMNYTVWIRNDLASEGCVQNPAKKSQWDCDSGGLDGTWEIKSGSPPSTAGTMVDKNHRVMLRSEGVGRDGISIVTLEVIISRPGGLIPPTSYSQAGGGAQGASSGGVMIAPP